MIKSSEIILPKFNVTNGCIDWQNLLEIDNPSVYSNGFVLKETEAKDTHNDNIHHRHAYLALTVLTTLGLTPITSVVCSEGNYFAKFGNTPQHLDGLGYKYWQVHTTHTADNIVMTSHSQVNIQAFNLSQSEHDYINKLAERRKYRDPGSAIDFHPDEIKNDGRYIPKTRIDRPADTISQVMVGNNSTIVFPNGYDGRLNRPSRLHIHEFDSVTDTGLIANLLSRYISISRIEPLIK